LSFAKSRLYFGSRSQNSTSRFIGELPELGVKFHHQPSHKISPVTQIDDEALDRFLTDEIDIDEFLNF
jgi:hypothetical protein